MPLRTLLLTMINDAAADAVVDHMFNDVYLPPGGEGPYMDKYFHEDVRLPLFAGGSIAGRTVTLSPKAKLLKSALQRRHVQSGCTRFLPNRANHQPIAPIILEVIIYSRLVSNAFPTGGDLTTFYRPAMDMYVAKNPLVIFPTAVFHRGDKFANVGVDL
jgi:hypothetical protein